jgi:S-DNA-T family DNA segregation ATPase FtsK/SpoIIIE
MTPDTVFSTTVLAPSLPEPPRPFVFPVVATVAPIILGLAMWAVTKSVLSLVFAGLGPIIAIGSVVDARLQGRSRRRSESARFEAELRAATREIESAHEAERVVLNELHPRAHDARIRWHESSTEFEIRLGEANGRSSVAVTGMPPPTRTATAASRRLGEWATAAGVLARAPVVLDLHTGIAIIGDPSSSAALVRSIIVQLAARLSPAEWAIEVHAGSESWMSRLPHAVASTAQRGTVTFRARDGPVVHVYLAPERSAVPAGVLTILDGQSLSTASGESVTLRGVERLSLALAGDWARAAAEHARANGIGAVREELPTSIVLTRLLEVAPSHGLSATFLHTAHGPFTVDLVADGPHAVVGGTTGSGKSELLISWGLALVADRSPDDVSLLLVDFKGGATFGQLRELPHCVGLVTDLDERGAARALESLAAEVSYRERVLAREGARSIDECATLPRLVILIDEFAALTQGLPALSGVVADLAARGRSLGIHLVLCTQRPVGVVRDAVFANVAIRLSLRVQDASDSIAVIATPEAAEISARARGRALVRLGGEAPRAVQVALATAEDIATVADRWKAAASPRRPWLDPLPARIDAGQLTAVDGEVSFAIADLPHEQSQPTVGWNPVEHGALVVVGASRSGTSSALRAIARSPGMQTSVARDPVAAWDLVGDLLDRARGAPSAAHLLVIDDLDVVIGRLGRDHEDVFVERLIALVREGPAAGIHCALGTHRITGALGSLLALTRARLILRLTDRQEHSLAGGRADGFDDAAPPGRGSWFGQVVQVAFTELEPATSAARVTTLDVGGGFAVVSTRPAAILARVANATLLGGTDPRQVAVGGGARVLVGDPDAWQVHWGAVSALRRQLPLVIDGCSVAEFRAVTGSRALPPPLAPGAGQFWLLTPDGVVTRATWGAPKQP